MTLDTGQQPCHSANVTEPVSPSETCAPCGSRCENAQTISSKFGHGGPRENSGGPRENSGGSRPGAGRPYKIVVADIPPGPRWIVYQTHPQAETAAANDLTRSGYRSYAPLIAIRRRDITLPSLFHKVRVARFPGYGFCELSPGDPWQPILEADGVSRILRDIYGRPARLPLGEVEKHMADDDRLCDLTRETLPALPMETRVTILDGALALHQGIVSECDGLCTIVDVEMFGRRMSVRLSRSSVEPVGAF